MEYIGEHLLPGKLGHFFTVLSFVISLLATVAYFFATQNRDNDSYEGWRNIGRTSFIIHAISVWSIIGIIFYIMINQYFEYQYAWAHVSEDLPMRYIFSAFWEGQEGSFLLWMFWHVFLGLVLMKTAKSWEAPVLSTLSLIQAVISTMILGLYFYTGDAEPFKLGSSPTLLLRDVMNVPIFNNADYVSLIKGTGLNPLLQNYWMTIHPPVLFLGFASGAIPFCYAVAGLWTGRHKAFIHAVTPWALFAGSILGTGILMGGAWAYEALTFGGYWAWDPVENSSLVPWIVLVAGIHTNLVARSTGYSIKSTYLFYLLTFLLLVYSTTLTRSGILGDTSVHAFTEMGLEAQLLFFISLFTALGFGLYIAKSKTVPVLKKEEGGASKEFWMFIGSLVLFFSALLITFTTSIPVFQKTAELFGKDLNITSPIDPIEHYNKYQMWIGMFIGILAGAAQFLRWREFNWKGNQSKFMKHMIGSLVVSALFSFLAAQWINVQAWQYKILLFTSIFAVISNLDYLIFYIKGNLKAAGSAISHIGFGLMIVGTLASGLNKKFISTNPFAQKGLIEGFSDEDYQKNVLLIKNRPMFMNGYEVTYVRDSFENVTRHFEVNYKKRNEKGDVEEEFNLYPNVLFNKQGTEIAAYNPSTKRYLHKDIFTHVSSLPRSDIDQKYRKEKEDSLKYNLKEMVIGGKSEDEEFIYELINVNRKPRHLDYKPEGDDLPIGVKVKVTSKDANKEWIAEPMLVLRGMMLFSYPVIINDLGLKVKVPEEIIDRVLTSDEKLNYQEFQLKEGDRFEYKGHQIHFMSFNREPKHESYEAKEGDLAVSAVLNVITPAKSAPDRAEPVFLIRGNQPFNLKDEIEEIGLHFRFANIDPTKGTVQLMVAKEVNDNQNIPVKFAKDVPQANFIVLQAIEFPGINFFWLGATMMMIGLLMAMFHRLKTKHASA